MNIALLALAPLLVTVACSGPRTTIDEALENVTLPTSARFRVEMTSMAAPPEQPRPRSWTLDGAYDLGIPAIHWVASDPDGVVCYITGCGTPGRSEGIEIGKVRFSRSDTTPQAPEPTWRPWSRTESSTYGSTLSLFMGAAGDLAGALQVHRDELDLREEPCGSSTCLLLTLPPADHQPRGEGGDGLAGFGRYLHAHGFQLDFVIDPDSEHLTAVRALKYSDEVDLEPPKLEGVMTLTLSDHDQPVEIEAPTL